MKTELNKMLNGELYNPSDEYLSEIRTKCKLLCQEYNKISYDDYKTREKILKNIIGKFSGKICIEQTFFCDYGFNIEIGENFYSNHNLVILDPAPVKFGNNVFIGPNCGFYTAEHPKDVKTRNEGFEYAKPITVGDNVWIGGGVSVLAGVTIGNNVIIGAGSVIKNDIPDNCIAAGVPARKIKDI